MNPDCAWHLGIPVVIRPLAAARCDRSRRKAAVTECNRERGKWEGKRSLTFVGGRARFGPERPVDSLARHVKDGSTLTFPAAPRLSHREARWVIARI